MSDTDNQDFYEGSAADAPLIDSLGSAVKRLIDKGKVRGYITVEELNKALPPEKESSEQIEDIMSEISDMGISIISESDADNFEPDVVEEEDDYDESGNFEGLTKNRRKNVSQGNGHRRAVVSRGRNRYRQAY